MTPPRLIAAIGATQEEVRSLIGALGPVGTQPPLPGQTLAWDGTAWVPSTGSGGAGGGLLWSLTTPWTTISALLATTQATLILVEGDPSGTPRLLTGATPQDFSGVLFIGMSKQTTTNIVSVQLDVGVSLTPGTLRSKDILWIPLGTDLVAGPSVAANLDFDGGGLAPPSPISGASLFRARSGEDSNVRLRNGATLDGSNLGPTDDAIFRLRPSFSGEVVLRIESYGGSIGPRCFINFVPPTPTPPFPIPVSVTAVVSMNLDAKTLIDPGFQSTTPSPHSGISLAVDTAKRDQASLVGYDDGVAQPPLNVNDVQNAIDVLKTSLMSGATVDRPPASFVGQPYFDTDLGKPIWWNGTMWVDATGAGPV